MDFSTAYARRRAHAGFAEAWALRLGAYRARSAQGHAEGEEAAPHPDPLPHGEREKRRGEELIGGKRVSGERWGKRRREAFLAELAATANVRRACAAAGLSTTAMYRRRLKEPALAAAWDAAVEVGRARLNALLVEAANRSFDPGALPIGEEPDALPRVSVSEAIHIAKMKGAERPAGMPDNYEYAGRGQWRPMPRSLDEVRDSILTKLGNLVRAARKEREALGWGWDEEHQMLIPPGWTRIA